jgi:uncharacterized glyoxalase superfamily protein PhnB
LNEKKNFIRAAPVLPVDDATRTAEYYENTLGFEIRARIGDPPFYVVVQREGVRIHLSEREDTRRKIEPCTVYVFVREADALYAELHKRGVEMFSPPEDQAYGVREFEMSDVNGHFLVFGEVLEGRRTSSGNGGDE